MRSWKGGSPFTAEMVADSKGDGQESADDTLGIGAFVNCRILVMVIVVLV